jgi:phosphoglycerol transferase
MVSEWLSLLFFIASVSLYTWKAGRHKLWFSAVLVLLGVYIVLNASLLASNYFTGEGINDAVIYTITSSLSGAGVQKYILPAVALIITLLLLFLLLSWVLRLRKNHNNNVITAIPVIILGITTA